jgi:hypothetical protein
LIIRGFWHADVEATVKKRERGKKVNAVNKPVNSNLDVKKVSGPSVAQRTPKSMG